MAQRVWTQLMFEGNAEEAMNFYVTCFPDSRVVSIERYGSDDPQGESGIDQAGRVLRDGAGDSLH